MKKNFKFIKIFTFLIAVLLFVQNVHAASNPYPKYQESPFGGKIVSCTWYAWQQAHDRMGVNLPFWTYVETWYKKAKSAGYSVGTTPKANSIMIWNYGDGFGGHAAYVTSIKGNTITFDEGGSPMTKDGIYTGNQLTMDEMKSFLVGFIYLDSPKKVEQKTTKNNTKTTSNTKPKNTSKSQNKETVKKSSDNSLSNLSIEGIEFKFNSNKLEYQLEVEYELSEISIKATANDKKAKVVGSDNYKLKVGENKFVIKVTAEDGSKKEYKINIIRKEKEMLEETNEEIKEENNQNINTNKKQNKNNIIFILVGSSLIIIAVIGICIYRFKIHK